MLQKLILLIQTLKNSKIYFKNPPKEKLLIFDNSDIYSLEISILKNLNYFVYEDRLHLVTKLYFSYDIIKKLIKHKKFGFKTAYTLAVIELVNPKLVLTFIHNSETFSLIAKILHKKFNFLAIQNSSYYYRVNEFIYLKKKYNHKIKNFFIPHLLGYSNLDRRNYDLLPEIEIRKFETIGSLRLQNFKEKLKNQNLKLKKIKYDICLLSEAGSWELKDEKLNFKFAKLIKFVIRYSKENNKKLIFALKRQRQIKNVSKQAHSVITNYYMEQDWIEKYLNKNEYSFLKKRFKYNYPFSSYHAAWESNVLVAGMSTMMREMFSQNKKILACNFTSNHVYDFPIKGISSINFDCDYNYFKRRLNLIFKLTNKEYFKKVIFRKDFDLNSNKNNQTHNKILNVINSYIN